MGAVIVWRLVVDEHHPMGVAAVGIVFVLLAY